MFVTRVILTPLIGFFPKLLNTSIFENVYNRVVPYFKENIEPLIKNNNVLIISHENTLRALYKYLKNISDIDIEKFEIKNNELIVIN